MVKSLSRVQLLATPWTAAFQAPPSMGFSRQEYWSGVPFPSPGVLPYPPSSKFLVLFYQVQSPQFSSAVQLCLTLCDPMNHSTPGLPVHHQLLVPTQTHVHRVGDAIQPSHPLLSSSPPALNPSQQQGLFQ